MPGSRQRRTSTTTSCCARSSSPPASCATARRWHVCLSTGGSRKSSCSDPGGMAPASWAGRSRQRCSRTGGELYGPWGAGFRSRLLREFNQTKSGYMGSLPHMYPNRKKPQHNMTATTSHTQSSRHNWPAWPIKQLHSIIYSALLLIVHPCCCSTAGCCAPLPATPHGLAVAALPAAACP